MTGALDKPPVWMVAEIRRRTGLPLHECRRMLEAATLAGSTRNGGDYGKPRPSHPAENDPPAAPHPVASGPGDSSVPVDDAKASSRSNR